MFVIRCKDIENVKLFFFLGLLHLKSYLTIKCMLDVRYFPKGIFPRENIPSGNFPNVQFSKRKLLKGQVRPSQALQTPQATMGPRAAARIGQGAERGGQNMLWGIPLRLGHTWEQGSLNLGKCPLGSCRLGKGLWGSTKLYFNVTPGWSFKYGLNLPSSIIKSGIPVTGSISSIHPV